MAGDARRRRRARARACRGLVAALQGIGLSGQMHGAVLLDEAGAVLRPAILWNDVRAAAECARAGGRPSRLCDRSPAISPCPASPRRSCCGCAGTSRTIFARRRARAAAQGLCAPIA